MVSENFCSNNQNNIKNKIDDNISNTAEYKPTDFDVYLFHQGTHFQSYDFMGAHFMEYNGQTGVRFTLWAPRAKHVSLIGDFNQWNSHTHPMKLLPKSGIWYVFVTEVQEGDRYKFEIETEHGTKIHKSDPYAFYAETLPGSASKVYNLDNYQWQDNKWQKEKNSRSPYRSPMSIYEVHLGSWMRKEDGSFLNYRELANSLPQYMESMNYTHVEFMPVMEHPFDGSWGYQITGYYAATSRYGTPRDFMYLVDKLHQHGIGVILDWVPGHFARDGHGLIEFDGTPTFEAEDYKRSENFTWGTRNFDYGRPEVQSFLISNALFWMKKFHVDGLRVDAVASILYLDYGLDESLAQRNQYGGRENLEGIAFIKKLNRAVFEHIPNALMMAEESTSWPLVSKPIDDGGLGFNFKWNMGWMNDMLEYMELDPFYRKWNHNLVTFSFMYAFSENFILPISHDEVVHEKKSLLSKMPGDYWQKFANLRAFMSYKTAHPGKKLSFMGNELGQFIEWRYYESLEWHLLEYQMHQQLQDFICELNELYCNDPAFYELDFEESGFQWIDPDNSDQSIIAFVRKSSNPNHFNIIVCNFTPNVYHDYRVGIPGYENLCYSKENRKQESDKQLDHGPKFMEIFNSDWQKFGGSGQTNDKKLTVEKQTWHNEQYSLTITVPPLATVFLSPDVFE